tara:strand:- start:436 stop:726 length:291 start_codon:yes stop_codon:yes gene_type:complete
MSLDTVFLKREVRELEEETFNLYTLVDTLETEIDELRQVILTAEAQKPTITPSDTIVDSFDLKVAENVVFVGESIFPVSETWLDYHAFVEPGSLIC